LTRLIARENFIKLLVTHPVKFPEGLLSCS